MYNSTKFKDQIKQELSKLNQQKDTTAQNWRDIVKEKFYNVFMEDYNRKTRKFVHDVELLTGELNRSLREAKDLL